MGTTGQSITLANSIIGVGILAMPFCFQQCGILLATLILISMGLVSRLCCYFLLKSAIITRRRNYEFLAFHIFGPSGKMAVELGIIGFLMGTCIAYFVVVGDLGPQIIAKMLNINQSNILRTSLMVIVSLVCVLPLGLLRNVDSLSNVSAATIAFYFCLVIKVIAEATTQFFTGDWTSRIEMWKPSGVLQCVPIFSMALFCQTQLFEIFESLPTLSLEKMCLVTKNAINICSSVYFTLGVFGYIAFGSQEISGNVLMSLSPTLASDVIKLGFVLSLALSFPLIIFPCRASLYSFLYRRAHPMHEHSNAYGGSAIPPGAFRSLTLGIVGLSLGVGLLLPTVELVLGLLGATVGVLVCVVLPAAAFLSLPVGGQEKGLAKFTVILGVIILILGTYANLQAADLSRDKFDDRYITQERIDKMVEDFFQKRDKSDEAIIKPVLNLELPQELNFNNPIIKDSEVQPPNPIPPESHSNEKLPAENKIIEIVAQDIDKVSESHPKNLKLKEENVANGVAKVVEEKKEEPKPKPKEDKQPNQDKIEIMKQKQLIETIKQHGKEQKELMEEQKEILDEILKTKQELKKNKDESSEAKKIAVESIKKIANAAIKSLSGVTDTPLNPNVNDPLKKIANDAVNDINKNAEETLDAIQQIDTHKNLNKLVLESKDVNVNKNAEKSVNTVNNVDSHKNVDSEIVKNDNKSEAIVNKLNEPKSPPEQKPIIESRANLDNTKREVQNDEKPKYSEQNLKSVENKVKTYVEKQNLDNVDSHVNEHKNEDNMSNVKNVPVLLMSNDKLNNKDEEKANGANYNGVIMPRRKREVVDCTEKTLQPQDKQICEDLVNKPESNVYLKNIDLGDVGLSLPIKMLHMRSLKSIQDKRR